MRQHSPPSQEEKQKIAAGSCTVMGETRNIDGAVRVEKINDAREKIGTEPFFSGDGAIKEALTWDLCQELVLNENYDEKLQEEKIPPLSPPLGRGDRGHFDLHTVAGLSGWQVGP